MIDTFLLLTPILLLAVVALVGFLGCSFQPGEAATLRKTITINHTMVSGSSPLSDFPVLIFLPSDSDLVNANASASTIFFFDSNNTQLNQEIEVYDSTSGQLIAWVEVPTLSPDTDTELYMEYSNSNGSPQDASYVWASYQGVWHLGNGTTLSANDSTANANNGTINGATAANGQTQLDGAASFDGTAAFIDVGAASTLDPSTAFTIEVWANAASTQPSVDSAIVSKLGQAGNYPGYMIWFTGGKYNLYIDGNIRAAGATNILGGDWYYVVAVWDGANAQVYLNGNLDVSSPYASAPTSANQPFQMGQYKVFPANLGPRNFAGILDEVRFSNSALSAGRIQTTYNNQSSPQTFYTVGPQEIS